MSVIHEIEWDGKYREIELTDEGDLLCGEGMKETAIASFVELSEKGDAEVTRLLCLGGISTYDQDPFESRRPAWELRS